MWGSLNTVFNFKQNTLSYIAKNDVRPTIYFKIISLARVRFGVETPALESAEPSRRTLLCFSEVQYSAYLCHCFNELFIFGNVYKDDILNVQKYLFSNRKLILKKLSLLYYQGTGDSK
jgi:hypothetical protein